MDSNGKKCCDRCAAPYVPGGLSCWDENCGCHRGVCVMTAYAEPWCRGQCAELKNCTATPEPDTPPGRRTASYPQTTPRQHGTGRHSYRASYPSYPFPQNWRRTSVVPASYPSSYLFPTRMISAPPAPRRASEKPAMAGAGKHGDMDDSIPFAPEWR